VAQPVAPAARPAWQPSQPPAAPAPAPGFTAPSGIAPAGPSNIGIAAPATTVSRGPQAAIDPADVALDDVVTDTWQRTITFVNGRKRMLGAFLEESSLVGVAGDVLVLGMDDLHRSVIDTGEHRPMVLEELARAFGRTMDLRCVAGEAKSVTRRTSSTAESMKPMIDKAMQMFDGEIIEKAPERAPERASERGSERYPRRGDRRS
jgi:hypothetical protein